MLRRLSLTVAVVTGLLAVAVSVLIAYRVTLAEAVLSSRLASLGIPAARLTVDSLDFRRIAITDIALGAEAEIRADAVTLTYSPGALLSGQVEDISIVGLRLRLDLSGAGPPLGSLQPLLEGGDGAAGPAAMPALVNLSRGRIEAVTPSGDVAAAIAGRWRPAAGTAALTLSDVVLPHVVLETSRLDIAVTPDHIDATATARADDDALHLDFSATIDSWRGHPMLALDLDGDLAPAMWRLSPLPAVDHGTLGVSLHIAGRLQPIETLSADADMLDWFFGGDLGGLLDASLTGVAWRDRAQGISGTLSLAVSAADGGLEVESAGDGHLRIARIDPAWLDTAGVAAVMPELRDTELTAVLSSRDAPLRLRARPTDGGADIAVSGAAGVALAQAALHVQADVLFSLDESFSLHRVSVRQADLGLRDLAVAGHRLARLHLAATAEGMPDDLKGKADLTAQLAATRIETLSLGGAALDLAADFGWSGHRLDIRQRGDGSASIAAADLGTAARIARPFSLALTDGALTLDIASGGPAVAHAITLRPEPVTVELPRAKVAPVVLRADTGAIRLEGAFRSGEPYRGELTLARGHLSMPDEAISAEEVSAAIALAPVPGERLAQFTVGRLAHTADRSYFTPLRIAGRIDRRDDTLELSAAASGANGALKLSVRGRHGIADGRGTAQITLPETAFRKGALQPGQISPMFRELRGATGRIGAVAEFAWSPRGFDGKGALELADISFTTDALTVEGLDTSIALDDLFPLSTRHDQMLAVRHIDPALPVEDIAVRFRVDPADQPRLHLKEATGRFAGGRLRVSETVLDPSRPRQDLSIGVDGIDLGILLGLVNVEGVSGTGRLSGTIPVAVADGIVTVDDGRLAADAPGILRVRSEAATSALGGAGEQVALMLQALEDFRYDSLSATLDIDTDGAAAAMIRMQGNNPAVLKGYPFAFNIELGGNAADLLVALRQGAQISTDLVRPKMR